MKTEIEIEQFSWCTQDGECLTVAEMKTTHIFYALRMIWNHTAPAAMQLPGGRYRGPASWPIDYRSQAVREFITELAKRPQEDLSFWQWSQIGLMREWARSTDFQRMLNS